MKVVQVCAFANWEKESFETWKWFEANQPSEQIARKMESLFLTLFSKIMITKKTEDLKKANMTIGIASVIMDIPQKQSMLLLSYAKFFHYLGFCLDMKNKSYFSPSETVTSGLVEINDRNLKIMKIRENSKPIPEDDLNVIRSLFGKKSENIKVKQGIDSLGTSADYLFDWKKKFY